MEILADFPKAVTELIREHLWSSGAIHPAMSCDAGALFDTLWEVHQDKGKGRLMHNQMEEGGAEFHIFHYGQEVQNNPELWTKELLLARGLIFRREKESGAVSIAATPWPKFFNLGEDGVGLDEVSASATSLEATCKMDGSLGLLFHTGAGWCVTTKGSFASEQAAWATEWVRDPTHCNLEAFVPGITYLCEIIYVQNIVMIPYSFSKLVLLSAFRADGTELARTELEEVVRSAQPAAAAAAAAAAGRGGVLGAEAGEAADALYGVVGSGGPGMAVAAVISGSSDDLSALIEAVKTQWSGADREGVVVRFTLPNGASHRVKVKGLSYLEALKAKTLFSDAKICDAASKGNLAAVRSTVPEEFLADFDLMVRHVEDACGAALAALAEERAGPAAAILSLDGGKAALGKYVHAHSAWADGTPVSALFRRAWHNPSVMDGTLPRGPDGWGKLGDAKLRQLVVRTFNEQRKLERRKLGA